MIVEGLMTTTDEAGQVNVAPMGPIVQGNFESLLLRPFQGSTTCRNLTTTRTGVFHIVDRVGLIAEAAIRRLTELPPMRPAVHVNGSVLDDCCRWFEVQISEIDDRQQRTEMWGRIVHTGERRAHDGFNRARHAVIEAAILATRTHILPAAEIAQAFAWLTPAVEKTGGAEELEAFRMLAEHVGVSVMKDV